MLPILFEIGNFKLYSFGSFIAIGTVLSGLFINKAARSRKLHTHHLFDTVLFTLLAALVAARITYFIVYQNQFQSFGQLFYFWQGGLVAIGGLIVGLPTFLYFLRKEKDPVWQMLDIGALGLLIAWALGKFGCYLSSCTIGREASGFLSVSGTYPVDLFSTIWAALVFVVALYVWLKDRLSEGVIFFIALEGLLLGQLLINTLDADFGEGIVRTEAIILLTLIVMLYLLFWKLHGPKIEKNRWGTALKSFIFRRKNER